MADFHIQLTILDLHLKANRNLKLSISGKKKELIPVFITYPSPPSKALYLLPEVLLISANSYLVLLVIEPKVIISFSLMLHIPYFMEFFRICPVFTVLIYLICLFNYHLLTRSSLIIKYVKKMPSTLLVLSSLPCFNLQYIHLFIGSLSPLVYWFIGKLENGRDLLSPAL